MKELVTVRMRGALQITATTKQLPTSPSTNTKVSKSSIISDKSLDNNKWIDRVDFSSKLTCKKDADGNSKRVAVKRNLEFVRMIAGDG